MFSTDFKYFVSLENGGSEINWFDEKGKSRQLKISGWPYFNTIGGFDIPFINDEYFILKDDQEKWYKYIFWNPDTILKQYGNQISYLTCEEVSEYLNMDCEKYNKLVKRSILE